MHQRFDIEPQIMTEFLNEQVFADETFWLEVEPYFENVKALFDLAWHNHKHKLVFITGRHTNVREVTHNWIVRKANLCYSALLMGALQTKHKAMKYIGADLMIEDRYNEALVIAQQGFRSYMIRRDYNIEHEGQQDNIIWVDDVEQVLIAEGINNVHGR